MKRAARFSTAPGSYGFDEDRQTPVQPAQGSNMRALIGHAKTLQRMDLRTLVKQGTRIGARGTLKITPLQTDTAIDIGSLDPLLTSGAHQLAKMGSHVNIVADTRSSEAVEAIRKDPKEDDLDEPQGSEKVIGDGETRREAASRLLCRKGTFKRNRLAANAIECHLKRLFREIPFIAGLPGGVRDKVPQLLRLRKAPADSVLYRQGDAPELYYIILSGQVCLWTHIPLESTSPGGSGVLTLEQGTSAAHTQCYSIEQLIAQQEEIFAEDSQQYETASTHDDIGCEVSILGVGACFGEVGLLKDQPRRFTATTTEDCELLVIRKADFNRVITQELQKQHMKQVAHLTRQLLREFDFFKKLSEGVQNATPNIMHYARFKKGEIPFQEGDLPDRCFILLSGEVSVWKYPQSEGKETEQSRSAEYARRALVGNEIAMRICANVALKLSQKPGETLRRAANKVAICIGRKSKFIRPLGAARTDLEDEESDTEYIEELGNALDSGWHETFGGLVSLWGPGVLFGELALMNGEQRSATVVCDSKCEFLVIEKADFDLVLKEEMQRDRALQLPPHLPPLLEEIPIFSSLAVDTKAHLPYVMKFCRKDAGTVLFWEGDSPESCYFLLSGQASVWVTTMAEDQTLNTKVAKGNGSVRRKCHHLMTIMIPGLTQVDHAQESSSPLSHRTSIDPVDVGHSTSGQEMAHQTFQVLAPGLFPVAKLGQGVLFGEDALVNDKPRSATIKCDKDCYMLVIHKPDYDTVLRQEVTKAKVKALSAQVVRLLKEFSVFQQLEPHVQATLPDVVRYSKVPRGAVLFEQGSAPSCCYIVLSGVVTVWKCDDTVQPGFGKLADIAGDGDVSRRDSARSRLLHARSTQAARGHSKGEAGDQVRAASKREHISEDRAGVRRSVSKGQASERKASKNLPMPTLAPQVTSPPLTPVSAATMHKCMALASMLAKVDGEGHHDHTKYDTFDPQDNGVPVAALGPGIMFGELALLSDDKRDATCLCAEDCEFLLISREDFDSILKTQIKKANREKMDFLKAHAPVMRSLPDATSDMVLRSIEKASVPRHHMFITMGEVADSSVYFVWKGAVECYGKAMHTARGKRATPKKEELLKYGILMAGSVFGSVLPKTRMPYSIEAASSPCEVLRISADILRQFPDSIVQGLREFIEQGMSRRIERLPPMGAPGDLTTRSAGMPASSPRPATSHCLPATRGFMQIKGGDLPMNLHLGHTTKAFISHCPYRRAPSPGRGRASTPPEMTGPVIVVPPNSARDRDRRAQLRSADSSQNPRHRRSVCSSSAMSRAESLVMSRSPSARSLSPSRSAAGFIDTGSRSPSRSNLRAALVKAGERPFVDVALQENNLISKAGKHPGLDYALI